MNTTEIQNNTEQNVTTFSGKKVKWSGKAIRRGLWPEDGYGYLIDVYETNGHKFVAWIQDANQGLGDVLYSDSEEDLIQGLQQHEWASEDYFMAALQNAYPEEDIWVEEIE